VTDRVGQLASRCALEERTDILEATLARFGPTTPTRARARARKEPTGSIPKLAHVSQPTMEMIDLAGRFLNSIETWNEIHRRMALPWNETRNETARQLRFSRETRRSTTALVALSKRSKLALTPALPHFRESTAADSHRGLHFDGIFGRSSPEWDHPHRDCGKTLIPRSVSELTLVRRSAVESAAWVREAGFTSPGRPWPWINNWPRCYPR
jgi:hypothetical protein